MWWDWCELEQSPRGASPAAAITPSRTKTCVTDFTHFTGQARRLPPVWPHDPFRSHGANQAPDWPTGRKSQSQRPLCCSTPSDEEARIVHFTRPELQVACPGAVTLLVDTKRLPRPSARWFLALHPTSSSDTTQASGGLPTILISGRPHDSILCHAGTRPRLRASVGSFREVRNCCVRLPVTLRCPSAARV